MLIAQTGKGLIYIYIAAPAFLPRQHIRNSSLGPALPRSKVTATLQTESKQVNLFNESVSNIKRPSKSNPQREHCVNKTWPRRLGKQNRTD